MPFQDKISVEFSWLLIQLVEDRIEAKGGNTVEVMDEDLLSLWSLEEQAIQEIRGFFTIKELYLLLDIVTKMKYTVPQGISPSFLLEQSLNDRTDKRSLCETFSVDEEAFADKILCLSAFHSHSLIIQLKNCINNPEKEHDILYSLSQLPKKNRIGHPSPLVSIAARKYSI